MKCISCRSSKMKSKLPFLLNEFGRSTVNRARFAVQTYTACVVWGGAGHLRVKVARFLSRSLFSYQPVSPPLLPPLCPSVCLLSLSLSLSLSPPPLCLSLSVSLSLSLSLCQCGEEILCGFQYDPRVEKSERYNHQRENSFNRASQWLTPVRKGLRNLQVTNVRRSKQELALRDLCDRRPFFGVVLPLVMPMCVKKTRSELV